MNSASGSGQLWVDPVDVPLLQRQLDADLGSLRLRRAIVVPSTRLAYLARLAFGEGDYRVFYSDMTAALGWLSIGNDSFVRLRGRLRDVARRRTHA